MINIDKDKCIACGICGNTCPRHIPETILQGNNKVTKISSVRLDLCLVCGQCEAVCPNNAIHVEQMAGELFGPVPELEIKESQFLDLLRHRRSVRRYKEKPVPRTLLEKILEAAHRAPTGTGSRSTGVIVIDNPEILNSLSERFYALYDELEKVLSNPIARFIIRKRKGKKTLGILQSFVMPGMRWYSKWYHEGSSNEILRDCPVLILFYSPKSEPMGEDNCTIAAYHSVLMAELLGVGTCFNHLIPPACNEDVEVRKMLDLPDSSEVYVSLTAGFPKYSYKRTIPRRLASVRYL
jgi:nitroreductase/NAD-dependent dihydropyrimidine dehydrogenase PreA subunit